MPRKIVARNNVFLLLLQFFKRTGFCASGFVLPELLIYTDPLLAENFKKKKKKTVNNKWCLMNTT